MTSGSSRRVLRLLLPGVTRVAALTPAPRRVGRSDRPVDVYPRGARVGVEAVPPTDQLACRYRELRCGMRLSLHQSQEGCTWEGKTRSHSFSRGHSLAGLWPLLQPVGRSLARRLKGDRV
jgi:hypothetical protein